MHGMWNLIYNTDEPNSSRTPRWLKAPILAVLFHTASQCASELFLHYVATLSTCFLLDGKEFIWSRRGGGEEKKEKP